MRRRSAQRAADNGYQPAADDIRSRSERSQLAFACLEGLGAATSAPGSAAKEPGDTCTTHLTVVDGEGTLVSVTTTLLSSMGSRVVLPDTGVLMNNGMMWFDPRPGSANAIAPGARVGCIEIDMLPPDERDQKRTDFLREFGWDAPSFCISALNGEGCKALTYAIMDYLDNNRLEDAPPAAEEPSEA